MQPKTKYLLRSIFRFWNHYKAVLPYNLNWQVKLRADARRFLEQNPIVVSDVGARGEAPEELAPLYPYLKYHAFDADAEECRRINASPHCFHERRVFPYFIGENSPARTFFMFKRPGESSSFRPSKRFQDIFQGSEFGIDRELSVKPTSLDSAYSTDSIEPPDFLKLDTQGSELAILHGATEILKQVCMLEIEVEFLEMYQGQPLFHDVMKFMVDNGFELLYLNRFFGQREQFFRGRSRGQLIFGDALFGRREDKVQHFSAEKLAKYVVLLANYGHIDFANHLLALNPELSERFPAMKSLIDRHVGRSIFTRYVLSQIDKLALLYLSARSYNNLPYDSDRGWPTR